jgi:serine/threonine-protein kinase
LFKPISNSFKLLNRDSDELIVNRYKLKRLLGKGAMGKVYCAMDRNLSDLNVAIKFLSQSCLDEKIRVRFETEAKISALLGEQSIHIVKVKDYGLSNKNIPFYVMEFLEGDSLDKIIKKKALSLVRFLSLTRQICLALECAHNGILVDGDLSSIIHKDIKPSNIFVVKDPLVGELVKILDFGIAQVLNANESEKPIFMGTLRYCSPEQMTKQNLDPRSDIYSLGVTMYEMLTGDIPLKPDRDNFQGWYQAHHYKAPKSLPSYLSLSRDLEEIIMQCLAKSPEDRPQNVKEILKVINTLVREYNQDDINDIDVTPEKISTSKKSLALSLEERYHQSNWPSHKPQKKIVFPMVVEGGFVSFWAMLESQEIASLNPRSTFCYSHFLFQSSPHPMLLLLNLIYRHNYEPKWLPSYLDLQTKLGYEIITNLQNNKVYHILLFALNQPQQCQQILTVSMGDDKIKQLEMYLKESNSWRGKKQAEVTKKILQAKIEALKEKILWAICKATSGNKS